MANRSRTSPASKNKPPSAGHSVEENERAVDAIVARVKTEKADLESIQRVKTRLQAALIRKLDNKAGRRTAAASAARGATDAAAVAEQASGALAVATGGSGEVATATATVSRAVQLEVVLALWEADQEKKNLEQNLEKLRKVKADLDAAVAHPSAPAAWLAFTRSHARRAAAQRARRARRRQDAPRLRATSRRVEIRSGARAAQ